MEILDSRTTNFIAFRTILTMALRTVDIDYHRRQKVKLPKISLMRGPSSSRYTFDKHTDTIGHGWLDASLSSNVVALDQSDVRLMRGALRQDRLGQARELSKVERRPRAMYEHG